MKAFDLFKLGNQVRRLSLYQQTKNRRSIINITTVCNRHSSSFAISTSSSNYPHLKHRKTSICLGGIGIPNIPHISSTTQRKSFSTSFSSTESLITLPPPNSIDLLSLIPQSTLQTIKTLPEVEQTLSSLQSNSNSKLISSPNNKNILDGLERAIQIFQHVGETEYKSILLLKATFLSQCCQYDKAIKVLSSLLVLPENENKNGNGVGSAKDSKEEDTFTFVIMSCLIKMHWLNGSVPEGLEYAKIMNDMANVSSLSSLSSSPSSPSSPLMASFKQGCAMNALALCQLLNDKKNQLKDIDIVRIKKSRNNHDNDQLQDDIVDLHINQTNVLKMASEMLENSYNSSLVSSLSSANDADCANSNIISTKLGLACASSYCNQGVMELICNIMQNKTNNGNSDSDSKRDNNDENETDSAMKMWKKGIDMLDKLEKHNQEDNLKKQNNSSSMRHIYICKAIKARMYCNMAWTILFQSSYMNDANDNHEIHTQQPLKEDDLKEASEYATLALKLYDELMILGEDSDNDKDNRKSSDSLKQMTGRALGLVASCYARAGSAVTAEGLLQSAMDLCKQNNANSNDGHGMNIVNQCPMAQIDSRSIFLYYASLCSNWDKREPDAKKNEEFALGVNEKGLSESWKGVSAIYSGLWFFTVSDF